MSATAVAGLTGCTTKEDIGPDEPCATAATVRLCYGNTAMCPTEHTSLELADGTRLRPSGPVWQAYLPQQADGQRLRISYQVVPSTTYEPSITRVALSCLEADVIRCGTR